MCLCARVCVGGRVLVFQLLSWCREGRLSLLEVLLSALWGREAAGSPPRAHRVGTGPDFPVGKERRPSRGAAGKEPQAVPSP